MRFNAENAEMVFAIVAAAEKCKAPVILQMTPSTLRYLPPACFAGIAAAAAQNATVPVALHLDHGDSLDLVKECLDAGYTSVMFDGSRLPFDENAALTAEAVRWRGITAPAARGNWVLSAGKRTCWKHRLALIPTRTRRPHLSGHPGWTVWRWRWGLPMAFTGRYQSWIWHGFR